MHQIAHGIHAIDGLKMGRSYIIEGNDGLALIDTSSKGASEGILGAIEAIGHHPEDLRMIVATHYHFDHTGNVETLIDRSGAQLCVHEADAPYVDGRCPWAPSNGLIGPLLDRFSARPFALKVDRILHDGDVLPFAGGLQIIHAPGAHAGSYRALREGPPHAVRGRLTDEHRRTASADVDIEPRHGAGETVRAPSCRVRLRHRPARPRRARPRPREREDRRVGEEVAVAAG